MRLISLFIDIPIQPTYSPTPKDRSYDDMTWRKIDLARLDLSSQGIEKETRVFSGDDGIVDNTEALQQDDSEIQ